MKSLIELEKEAQMNENRREMLLIFPSGPCNGRWLDPYLGVFELGKPEYKDMAFYTHQFENHKVEGIFVD